MLTLSISVQPISYVWKQRVVSEAASIKICITVLKLQGLYVMYREGYLWNSCLFPMNNVNIITKRAE